MNTRGFIAIGLALLIGAPVANSQSFKDKLKKAAKQVSELVEDATSSQQTSRQQSSSQQNKKTTTSTSRSKTSSRTTTEKPTINLPSEHTALFAPLGYDIDATWGVKSAKPSTPPKDAPSQVAWVEKQPYLNTLDNQSIAALHDHLKELFDDGWFATLTPAHAFMENACIELSARCIALNNLVAGCEKAQSAYNNPGEPQWVIDMYNEAVAKVLRSDAYKTLLRSSIAPLFTCKTSYINDETKKYFAAHGGYANATKAKMTQWDPSPKETVSLSTTGQTGQILSENASGAHVDIDGIEYVVHVGKSGGYAYASQATKTAIAGKAIVMPDYITYKGGKYPVREMRSDLFAYSTVKSVKLPSTLVEISNAAFRETPITEITIPSSVKIVGGSAFQFCKKLTKVVFEGTQLEKINGCFHGCTALQSVKFPRSVKEGFSYDMFCECTNLVSVTLPEDLPEIPESTFEGCTKLTTVVIPASVKKICGGAFRKSGVTTLDLSHVTEFGSFCFSSCKSLKTVKLNATLKDNFVQETYEYFMECPLLQVKYVNNKYVIPQGFVFVDVK